MDGRYVTLEECYDLAMAGKVDLSAEYIVYEWENGIPIELDEYQDLAVTGRLDPNTIYYLLQPVEITLKCTWELNNQRTWENLEIHRWQDFKLVDYSAKYQQENKGIYLGTPGQLQIEDRFDMALQNSKLEHNKVVFEANGEVFIYNTVSEHDYFSRMRNYLPWYEKDDPVFREILKAYDFELRILENDRNVIYRNLNLDTMVENIPVWERDFGITKIEGLNNRQRREVIKALRLAQFGQLTRQKLKEIIETFSNAECELISDLNTNVVTIKFNGLIGVPDNEEGLKTVLDTVLPAHWGYEFAYTFGAWDWIYLRKWQEVKPYSWNEIKNWDNPMVIRS